MAWRESEYLGLNSSRWYGLATRGHPAPSIKGLFIDEHGIRADEVSIRVRATAMAGFVSCVAALAGTNYEVRYTSKARP